MSDNKITQDQLEPNVMEELESGIGDLSTLSTENKDSLVAAVTEIYGKNVIAEAIGEPLAVTDTFSEMGSEINSLLSSFKTNMMNSGVIVEGGDKFKQLIEKIKGLTEGEGNKGVQFAEGTCNIDCTRNIVTNIPFSIDFTPTYLFLYVSSTTGFEINLNNLIISNLTSFSTISGYSIFVENITQNGCDIRMDSITPAERTLNITKWYAIGVGEEDTTLRDSLADILENKGVDVTEEDDMASLITKVDDMTSNMIKYKSGIHEHTYDGNTRISFEVSGIGFRPTFVQVCRVNKSEEDGGYAFWINNDYMNDSNSIYIPVESIWDLKTTIYSGLNAGAEYDELVVNDDGFSLNILSGGTSGHLWHFEWFVLG